jgi:acetylornithine deacetylase/succinyl-diaminopimelate desuccinylase-like protein
VLAESEGIRDSLAFFSRERAWINERHLALCRVPSPTFFEQKRAEWMAAELDKLGWHVAMDRSGNVIAHPERGEAGPFVAVTAHLDTVLAPRIDDDIRVAPDGRYLGPGIADNGAGLAALLALAAAWREGAHRLEGATASPVLVANVGEEGEGNLSGMRYLCRQSPLAGRIRSFVVLDGPGTEHITAHALACRRFEVSFAGPGGHSWIDQGTANPVHALAATIADFTANPFASGGARTAVNFGVIEGGASINSIPSEARAKLDLRSESQDRMDELGEALTDAVERALASENERASRHGGPRLTAKIREIGSRPGGRLDPHSPLLTALRQVDRHLGITATLDCASTDANIPLSMGLAAASIGAGGQGGGAHTPTEWYYPEGRDLGLRRILLLLCHLLRGDA